MFLRTKTVGPYTYVQIVENHRHKGKVRQRSLANLGRLDVLQQSGQLDALLSSAARFSERLLILSAHRRSRLPVIRTQRIGPPLVFERLWRDSGCQQTLRGLLAERRFAFPVERAVFLEVLHRLVSPGSDRDGYSWRDGYAIDGVEELGLHHAYRAMAWLGETLEEPEGELAPRCVKDLFEERLFAHRRDLFSSVEVVFFDTTSLYFEGEGGEGLGHRGHSKDARPDLKQMIVGVVLDDHGHPLCCEMWPGNTADVTTLIPVAERLTRRFGVERVCVVADRGMISRSTVEALEELGWPYILGARLRSSKEVRETVLARAGRYREVEAPRAAGHDPSPLGVKEVIVGDKRYVVCRNLDQARKDAADREAIVASLEERIASRGPASLVGNSGFRRFLKSRGAAWSIDPDKVEAEARYDGKWVLCTNTDWAAAEVALRYKQLWMVEDAFRTLKSLLVTRPIYHKTDEAIRGHVFCSFLALVLRKQLQDHLDDAGHGDIEWSQALRDLDRLEQVEVAANGTRWRLRTETPGTAGKVCQAVGVALPPVVQALPPPHDEPTSTLPQNRPV